MRSIEKVLLDESPMPPQVKELAAAISRDHDALIVIFLRRILEPYHRVLLQFHVFD